MNTDELNRNVSDFEALHDVNLDGADALVAALQEAAAHIRDLRERIATLERTVAVHDRCIDVLNDPETFAALESNVQKMHGVQNGSGDIAPPAPIAEGTAKLLGNSASHHVGLLLTEDVECALWEYGRTARTVRIVIYADEEA